MPHILHTKDIGSITVYGDALSGGYDGTKAQLYSLIKGIADGAMLLEVGSRDIVLSAANWDNGYYDLTPVFPANRYMLLTVGIDGDTASGTEINEWYNAEVFLQDGNILFAHGTDPQNDIHIAVSYQTMLAEVAIPVQSGSLTYTGQAQSPTWVGYDSSCMTMSGDTTGTNAGTYSTTFTLSRGYKWSDGSKTPKTISWTIAKQIQPLPLTTYSVELPDVGDTTTVSVDGQFTGVTVSCASELATASISGGTITISRQGTNKGNAFIVAQTDDYPNITYSSTITAICGIMLYGVYWDGGTSPVMTRTDDSVGLTEPVAALNNGDGSSPFDEIYPWSGMQIVEDEDAGTLVSIPKFYYKWTRNGSTMALQISPTQFSGSFVSPLHADRGDGNGERDIAYVARYLCDTNYKSVSGNSIQVGQTRATFRTNIHALGSDIWQQDYAAYWTVRMLYLVEYANWNAHETIGQSSTYDYTQSNGATDSMVYHTGTTGATRATTAANIQYRHIENVYCEKNELVDGIYFSSATVYIIKNPASFSDSSGGTNAGSRYTGSYSGIKAFNTPSGSGLEYALYPKTSATSVSQYICGQQYGSSSDNVLMCAYRMFNYEGAATATTYLCVGRLVKLPNVA